MTHTAIVTIANGNVKHYWYDSRADAFQASQKFNKHGVDVYWAMAAFGSKTRKTDAVEALSSFWLDIDCGEGKSYATKQEALDALGDSFLPAPSLVVDSGNGLHAYWMLNNPVLIADWLPVANQLKRACVTHKLAADHVVTTDAARILRVPGTTNWKDKENPKPVVVLSKSADRYSLDTFKSTLPNVGPSRAAPSKVSKEWDIDGDYPPASLAVVLAGCQQMRHAAEVKCNGVDEPFWRAVLSVTVRCENGEKLIHSISKGDPRYDPDQTNKKAQGTQGPSTCEHFDAVRPGGCSGCPNKNAVKSPIAIIPPAPKPTPTPEVETEEAEYPSKIGDWQITTAGAYRAEEADDGGIRKVWAVKTPVYGETFRTRVGESEGDDARLTLVWLRPDGQWRRSLMPLSLVGSGSKMMEWAGAQGLATLIPNVKAWTMYISDLTNDLLTKQAVTQYYERLGWHKDATEFVLGKQMVTAEGLTSATLERNSPLSKVEPKGSLDAWKAGVALLEKEGLEAQMFCVLAGFGSPLLELADVAGAAVSLAGASGLGKTLAAESALSIYGDPKLLFQSADATKNSVDTHLATLNSVPYLLDEVSTLSDKRIGELLYMIANGKGKDTLTRNRTWRDGGSWRTLAFLTTNRPIMDADQGTLTEAQRNRAIEIVVKTRIADTDAAQVYGAISANHGVAAEPYLRYIINNKTKVNAIYEASIAKVKEAFGEAEAQRFGVWALAAALAGGLIAKQLGLITRNPWDIVKQIVPILRNQTDSVASHEDMFFEVTKEWLAQNSDHIASTSAGGARLGLVDDPIARIDGAIMFIHKRRLHHELRDNNISPAMLKDFLVQNNISTVTIRLAQGTPGIRSYQIPTKLLFNREEISEMVG